VLAGANLFQSAEQWHRCVFTPGGQIYIVSTISGGHEKDLQVFILDAGEGMAESFSREAGGLSSGENAGCMPMTGQRAATVDSSVFAPPRDSFPALSTPTCE
jgi:hypothetical protein